MPKSKISIAQEILESQHSDYTLLDCLAWLSGFFNNDLPDLSQLLDYIVSKDVFKSSFAITSENYKK